MEILYLGIVFLIIIIILWMKKPLFLAISGGIIATILLFRVPFLDALVVLGKQSIAKDTIDVLLSFYFVTFLQKMLERRNRLKEAQRSFDCLLRNRRLNAAVSSTVLGLLPSAAVMTVCADMVDQTCADYLDKKEKMVVACYYRHIPEMFLPTFSAVLLALTLSGVEAGAFVLSMIPIVLVACLLPYLVYLQRMPSQMPPLDREISKKAEVVNLLKNLWSLIAVVLIIIIFNLSVCVATPLVILVNYFIDRFKPGEIPGLLKESAEPILLGNMYLIMLFKGIITYTGVVAMLPDFFGQFPIPISLVFCLIFFFGSIISGSQAIIALCLPMAMVAIPDGGLPLLVMLMCVAWAAMQISPTHVCSFVAAKYYNTTLGDLVVRATPIVVAFSAIAYGYSMLLGMFF
jgi:hypothetical protein